MPESVGFVSWSVCACVISGASPGRGRGLQLWGCVKGLLKKKSRTVPWRETYHGKNINERLRQRKHPGGGGATPLYKLYRYLPPHRVGFLRRFGLKTGIHFAHFGLGSGMVFEGTTGVYERIYRLNSK